MESSDPLDCGQVLGKPDCTAADVDRRLDAFHRLGVRTLFVAHWVNNAFAGAALEGGAKGAFINVFNRIQTGAWFHTGACPHAGPGRGGRHAEQGRAAGPGELLPDHQADRQEGMPSYPAGRQCNVQGLTASAAYLIRGLMAPAHADRGRPPQRAGARAGAGDRRAHHYPLVSSHTDTGGTWTRAELRRLYALGGFATATAGHRGAGWRRTILALVASRVGPAAVRRRSRHRHRRLRGAAGTARRRPQDPLATRSGPTTGR